jgi:steroid delta-isomerase-like uncharacterized protein
MVVFRDAPPSLPRHTHLMTQFTIDSAIRQAREAVVRSHMDAECRHDVAATLETFAEPNYDVVPLGAPANGQTAVEELLGGLFAAFPDFDTKALSLHHGDDIVFVDTLITGTHQGNWAGVPASGRPIEVRCGCIFHFNDDQLTRETVYFDHATLLAQIGVQG